MAMRYASAIATPTTSHPDVSYSRHSSLIWSIIVFFTAKELAGIGGGGGGKSADGKPNKSAGLKELKENLGGAHSHRRGRAPATTTTCPPPFNLTIALPLSCFKTGPKPTPPACRCRSKT